MPNTTKILFHDLLYRKENFSNPQNGIYHKMEVKIFIVDQILLRFKKKSTF